VTGPPKQVPKGMIRPGHRLTPTALKHPKINPRAGQHIQTQGHRARCSLISHRMQPAAVRLPFPGS
jgi:hypothetical protein